MKLAFVVALLAFASAVVAAEKYAAPKLLVEPAELAAAIPSGTFVVLDARPEADYKKEHAPGARWVDAEAWAKAFGDGEDRQGWSERIGKLGIGADSKVVVYDDAHAKDAGRMWWILRYWGVADVRLLNGGWKTWKAEKRPATGDVPQIAPVAFQPQPNSARLAKRQDVLDAMKAGREQIIDARSEKEFCGLDLGKNKRGGAIPGAKLLEWSDLIDTKTDRFKSPAELRAIFAKAGIDLNRPTITHCQSGGRASVMVFGMELLGAAAVRNYYRGWSEWGNRPDTPIVEHGPSVRQVPGKP